MNTEQNFSGEESLKLINKMIQEAKGYYYESGLSGLVYGFSIIICSILAYMREIEMIRFPFQPFYLLIPVFFLQAIIQMREDKKKKAKTFTDETIDYVWMGFFISALVCSCAVFAGFSYFPVSMAIGLIGFATFLTGMIAKFRYHIVVAFACWALCIASFFTQQAAIYLLLAATAVLAWVIPGFLLRMHFKKLYKQQANG